MRPPDTIACRSPSGAGKRLGLETVAVDFGPYVRLRGVDPCAAEFHRVPVVVRRVGPAAQPVARLDQHSAAPAHRQLASGRHPGEPAADNHGIRMNIGVSHGAFLSIGCRGCDAPPAEGRR